MWKLGNRRFLSTKNKVGKYGTSGA